MTTVKQLRELMASLPDDALVLTDAPDHEHFHCTAEAGTALHKGGVFTEDHGEADTPEKEFGKRIKALLIH